MNILRSIIPILLAGIFLLAAVILAGNIFVTYKTMSIGGVTVTGSASKDFTSDLIVWRGSFSRTAPTSREAYSALKQDAAGVKSYLLQYGVNEDEMVFSSVNISPNYSTLESNDANGNKNTSNVISGYILSQNVIVTSSDVNKIEVISRDVTNLIDSGVYFTSNPPEYYYTQLDQLKIAMIADATANAQLRAQKIADNTNARLGKLLSANLGVFQIVAANSSGDNFSSSGAFDTSSKLKTASITVRLSYSLGGPWYLK